MDTERQPVSARSFLSLDDLLVRRVATGGQPAAPTQEASSQPRPRRDPRYWITRLGVGLPLVSLLLVWLALVFYPAPRIATGDPLTDEVLRQAVRRTQKAGAEVRAENLYQDRGRPGSLADRLEHALPRARWASDPHWWELEYQLRQSAILSHDVSVPPAGSSPLNPATGVAASPTLPPVNDSHTAAQEAQHKDELAQSKLAALEVCEQSRASVTSAPLLLQELRQRELAWEDEGRSWYRLGFPGRDEDRTGYWKLVRFVTKQHHAAEEQALLTALRTAAPGEALPCYWEARLAFMEGETDKALALIAEGNAKPQCSQLELYPAPALDAALAAGRPLADQPASSSLLVLLYRRAQDNSQVLEGWRPVVLALASTLAKQRNATGLSVLQRLVARLGAAATDPDSAATCVLLDRDLFAAVLKDWTGAPSTEMTARMAQATQKLGQLSQEIKAVHLARSQVIGTSPGMPLGKLVAIGSSRLDFGAFSTAFMAKFNWDTASREQQILQTQVRPLWQELAVRDTFAAGGDTP